MTKRQHTELGVSIVTTLRRQGRLQRQLAADLNQTSSYVSAVLKGRKSASAQWIDLVANALELNEKQRRELHLKAARQLGFKL